MATKLNSLETEQQQLKTELHQLKATQKQSKDETDFMIKVLNNKEATLLMNLFKGTADQNI